MRRLFLVWALLAPLLTPFTTAPAQAQAAEDLLLQAAREALRTRDRAELATLAERARAQNHALASWVAYWDLGSRLGDASVAEVQAFYRAWPGTYVEDRLRNDWLLELGRRRDWAAFAADYPAFRMDDDRDVHCYAVLAEHAVGRPVKPSTQPLRTRANAAWLAQRDASDACALMGRTLTTAQVLRAEDVWRKLRWSVEANRLRAFKQTDDLLPTGEAMALDAAFENPTRFLLTRARSDTRAHQEQAAVALVRLAASDSARAAQLMRGSPGDAQNKGWAPRLSADLAQWVWSQIGRQGAQDLATDAADAYRKAFALGSPQGWTDETWQWALRAALRANSGAGDWVLALQVADAQPEPLRADSATVYWRAQALYRSAAEGPAGDPQRHEARVALTKQVAPLHFYGQLAADDLGLLPSLPPTPAPLTEAERQAAAQHPGLSRGLLLIAAGLRSEGVREWNFSLRDIAAQGDRALLAAAQRACDAAVWDRCISTSERTRTEIDLRQRYPTPFREQVSAQARQAGLQPADPFGLIRQESRFILDAKSGPGAAGLMQVMPATAAMTARKIGMDGFKAHHIKDADTNLRIGMAYLRQVLDNFGGALPLAAAAYNAGPGRPARWRQGPELDAAAWAENIPFTETRDYVKKVLANATVYARLLGQPDARLRERLGQRIGPRAQAGTAASPSSSTATQP
jgi:soluble lytic murein transglycosylase